MRVTRRDRIEKIINALEEQMRALKSLGLHDCASLVRIAWLDLRRRNDRISIRELQALCDRVANDPEKTTLSKRAKKGRRKGVKKSTGSSATRTAKRPRKSAHIIDMQAWRSRIPSSSK